MNHATQMAVDALLAADASISPDQKLAALEILEGLPWPARPPLAHQPTRTEPLTLEGGRKEAPRNYLRRPEAARYLGCSVRQLDTMKADGEIPFCYLGRRLIAFRIEDLDEFMSKHRIAIGEQGRQSRR